MKKEFYHELQQPYQALIRRSVANDLVGLGTSDITARANALAVSAAHFLESKSLLQGSDNEKMLREMLQDVADSAKHGQLRVPERTIRLSVSLAYEIDDGGRSRFLRTEVKALNQRFGSFDLIETIGSYLRLLNERLAFGFVIEPVIDPEPFGHEAIAKITDNTAEVGSTNIRIYKRDLAGRLIPTDPTDFFFVVR